MTGTSIGTPLFYIWEWAGVGATLVQFNVWISFQSIFIPAPDYIQFPKFVHIIDLSTT